MSLATNPLPPVSDGDVRVGFELVATVPADADQVGPASIQELRLVPGGDGALAAVDTRGPVWLIEDGVTAAEPLIDLRDQAGFVRPGPESGLRSLAFHPDHATEGAEGFGLVYVAYSASVAGAPADTRVFEAEGAAEVVFHDVYAEIDLSEPDAVRELFRVEQPFRNHNAGQLNFDPAAALGDVDRGLLYVGLGDGGSGNDPLNAAEDLGQILGKILRIDPLGDADGAAYGVPGSNPFMGDADALPEIWAYGFRNPQQFSFDDDLIFASDIGQSTLEEINVVRRGADHGWDDREGTLANTNGAIGPLPADDPEDLQYPLTQYDHEEITGGNAAVGGGFVYRGDDIPGLRGSYVFSNFPTGRLFSVPLDELPAALADGRVDPTETRAPLGLGVVDADGEPVTFAEVSGNASGRVDLRLGLDADGEILAFSKQTGNVYRLTAAPEEDSGGPITGTPGDDVLVGTAGDDVFATGGGRDRVEVDAGGSDVITDFDVDGTGRENSFDALVVTVGGVERVLTTTASFVAFADLLAADGDADTAATVEGADLVLALGGGDVVRLEGVIGPDLSAEDVSGGPPAGVTLTGGPGDDVQRGTAGDDAFTTGGGRDRVVLGTLGEGGAGSDVVTDFDVDGTGRENSFDRLEFAFEGEPRVVSGTEDFADLSAELAGLGRAGVGASVEGADLVLALGGGDVVRLEGVIDGDDLRVEDIVLA